MDQALIFSAVLMGLAGTPHCLAMCGAACSAATLGGPTISVAAFAASSAKAGVTAVTASDSAMTRDFLMVLAPGRLRAP